MRLSPVDPLMFVMQTGMAAPQLQAGRFEESASWAERAGSEGPNWVATLRLVAASNALAGHFDRAQMAAARLLEFDPEFRISSLKRRGRSSAPAVRRQARRGLKKSGAAGV